MTGDQIRVFCVDDNPSDLRLLELLMGTTEDLLFVGSASDTKEIVERVRAARAQVVVIDLRMRGYDSLDAINDIKRECEGVSVVAYSGFSDPEVHKDAIAHGAYALVTKEGDAEKLFATIRSSCSKTR